MGESVGWWAANLKINRFCNYRLCCRKLHLSHDKMYPYRIAAPPLLDSKRVNHVLQDVVAADPGLCCVRVCGQVIQGGYSARQCCSVIRDQLERDHNLHPSVLLMTARRTWCCR